MWSNERWDKSTDVIHFSKSTKWDFLFLSTEQILMFASPNMFIPWSWNNNATQRAYHHQVLVLFWCLFFLLFCFWTWLLVLIGFLLRKNFKFQLFLWLFSFPSWMIRSILWISTLFDGRVVLCVHFEIYFKQYFFTDNSLLVNKTFLLIINNWL